MNLNTFEVDDVMIHDVPRGNDAEEEIVLTDDPILLDAELRRYFQRKIVTSLTERGVEVVADANEDGTVCESVATLLRDPASLAAGSRTIAERLNDVQTGRNPAGLLAVATGKVDGAACVSVLKLEREQGLRFRIETINERRIVDLEFLRDLTLTDKTKVFKTSLLVTADAASATRHRISGRVSDDQRGRDAAGVASFFLATFLGCRLRDSPEKATQSFAKAAEAFINDQVASADRRGRYQVALLATLQDTSDQIRPRSFAELNLEPPDQPIFLDRVRQAELDPDVSFSKDTSLVKINGFKMTFESGMVLVGKRSDLEERVTIRTDEARTPGVEINDAVKKLTGR